MRKNNRKIKKEEVLLLIEKRLSSALDWLDILLLETAEDNTKILANKTITQLEEAFDYVASLIDNTDLNNTPDDDPQMELDFNEPDYKVISRKSSWGEDADDDQ